MVKSALVGIPGSVLLVGALASALASTAGAGPVQRGPAGGSARALPAPAFGRTLDIGLVSGTVIVTPPGRRPFKLGVQDRSVPIGSLFNTNRGRVDLRAAA